MDDSGQRSQIRSLTEPSTPLRRNPLEEESFTFYSHRRRTIFRTSDIHLPPHELHSITAKLSQESNSAPGSLRRARRRSRSRPRTPLTAKESISVSGLSPSTPTRNADKRRNSSNFTMGNKKRKRRSLIMTENGGTAFDPNYIGPITIDYLRLFCKIAIEEKIENENPKSEVHDSEIPIASKKEMPDSPSEVGDRVEKRNSPKLNDFDQSLPLPEAEGIPVSPDSSDLRPFYNSFEAETPPKKAFSYLERILAAQAKKNQNIDKETPLDSNRSFKEDTPTQPNPQPIGSTSIQSQFVIENNSAHIKTIPPRELHIHSDTDLENNAEFIRKESLFLPEESLGIDEQHLNNEQENNKSFNMNGEYNDIEDIMALNDTPKPESLSETISTPTENVVGNNFSNERLEKKSPNSPNAVINEEYIIGNDSSNGIFDEAFNINNEHNEIENNLEMKSEKSIRDPIARITTSNKSKPQNYSLLPINMVKNVVKLLQAAPTSSSGSFKLQKATQKVKRFTPDIYEFIQQKSDDFILNVVADLEAYSRHRTSNKSNQINIKDVLLYLKRIKFGTSGKNNVQEVDNIANLAYKFLPLELLISLDNNLHGRANNQQLNNYDGQGYSESYSSENELDYINETETSALRQKTSGKEIRHLKTFSDSEID